MLSYLITHLSVGTSCQVIIINAPTVHFLREHRTDRTSAQTRNKLKLFMSQSGVISNKESPEVLDLLGPATHLPGKDKMKREVKRRIIPHQPGVREKIKSATERVPPPLSTDIESSKGETTDLKAVYISDFSENQEDLIHF